VKCSECQKPLMVANSKYESPEGTTDVYNVLTMVCINPKCDNYSGTDLNHPKMVAATIQNKVG